MRVTCPVEAYDPDFWVEATDEYLGFMSLRGRWSMLSNFVNDWVDMKVSCMFSLSRVSRSISRMRVARGGFDLPPVKIAS